MKNFLILYLCSSALLYSQNPNFDQDIIISTNVDTTEVKIGEELNFKIDISSKNKYKISFDEIPNFMHFEILESFATDTIQESSTFSKRYSLINFEPGEYWIPPQKIYFNQSIKYSDSLLIVVNDVEIDNGPLMVIPESHKGPVLSHNNGGVFCGAINPDDKDFDLSKAVTLTGKARSMTIHHARTLHGSAPNNSDRDRIVLFYECNSADAWPLVGVGAYLKNLNPIELCNQLERQMVCGEVSYQPVMENVPVVLPLPPAPDYGSIFTTQKTGGAKSVF